MILERYVTSKHLEEKKKRLGDVRGSVTQDLPSPNRSWNVKICISSKARLWLKKIILKKIQKKYYCWLKFYILLPNIGKRFCVSGVCSPHVLFIHLRHRVGLQEQVRRRGDVGVAGLLFPTGGLIYTRHQTSAISRHFYSVLSLFLFFF